MQKTSSAVSKATTFDFRRPDRIAKSQLRAIHALHDNFARNLVSSLSAYLRSYLTATLVSVEQLSYAEFLQGLPSPTCLVSLGMKPVDGNAVLEINPSLIFPTLEMVLGGTCKSNPNIQREITEIEQTLLDGLFRIVLHDLREAWKAVSPIDFIIETIEKEPQFLRVLAPNEAVVAVAVEVRIGEIVGMMNIAMPSIVIKMMRQKFDLQWSVRKSESSAAEQERVFKLIQRAQMTFDVRLVGPSVSLQDLLKLEEGDVLTFDYPVERNLAAFVNGRKKFSGQVVGVGRKHGFAIEELTAD